LRCGKTGEAETFFAAGALAANIGAGLVGLGATGAFAALATDTVGLILTGLVARTGGATLPTGRDFAPAVWAVTALDVAAGAETLTRGALTGLATDAPETLAESAKSADAAPSAAPDAGVPDSGLANSAEARETAANDPTSAAEATGSAEGFEFSVSAMKLRPANRSRRLTTAP